MVKIGIIGLGPVWETKYRQVLGKLRQRLRVCAVYDPVASRAEQISAEYQAPSVQGLSALLEREDIQAVLLLDTDWQGPVPLQIVASKRVPAFIAGGMGDDVSTLQALHQAAVAHGLTLMPEFSQRYMPATSRLQELIATQIGRPVRILVDTTIPRADDSPGPPASETGSEFLIGLLDWCRYVVRTPPANLQSAPLPATDDDSQDRSITIQFQPSRRAGNRPVVELRIHETNSNGSPAGSASEGPASRYEVTCERGQAILKSPAQIAWTTDESATTQSLTTESLKTERSATEVMLDHFLRRVVGGLIPVADVADVCQSLQLARAAEQSLQTGRRINLNGQAESDLGRE